MLAGIDTSRNNTTITLSHLIKCNDAKMKVGEEIKKFATGTHKTEEGTEIWSPSHQEAK